MISSTTDYNCTKHDDFNDKKSFDYNVRTKIAQSKIYSHRNATERVATSL